MNWNKFNAGGYKILLKTDVLPAPIANICTFAKKDCAEIPFFWAVNPHKSPFCIVIILCRFLGFLGCFFATVFPVTAQRVYAPHSVLSSGTWFKLSVSSPGVYKMDIPFLNNLGVNTSNLSSNSIRLYGNGGQMLAEANAGSWTDDLKENAIMIVDGGDGIINASDYILFYATGPDEWIKDSANLRFNHRKNFYSDKSYYFLSVGGAGKRITMPVNNLLPNQTVTHFSERIFHELDTVNLLAGSKEWYGEEFTNAPGKTLTRNFTINVPNVSTTDPLLLQTNCIARSAGISSRFDIMINNQPAGPNLSDELRR